MKILTNGSNCNNTEDSKNPFITYPFVEGEHSILIKNLIYVENDKHKQIFYTDSDCYTIYRKLDDIEADLKPYGFLRIHQSFLVNMEYIQKISSYVLTMKDGLTFSVPKARYGAVKTEYAKYLNDSGDE